MTTLALPPVLKHEHSDDGTRKWLLDVGANQAVETVYIPEPDRGTLCISSQAGCALDCAFCATGYQGFNRNLTSAEIWGKSCSRRASSRRPRSRTSFSWAWASRSRTTATCCPSRTAHRRPGIRFVRRRVTISTAGVVPQMLEAGGDCNVAFAVSLHAPTDELRDKLVPINKVHPIAELLDACWKYAEGQASRSITFEYVMLDGVNDSVAARAATREVAAKKPAKMNLIPFNAFPESEFRCSPQPVIDAFWQTLRNAGLIATVRRPRGDDIAAACGQLAGRVRDRQRVRLGDRVIGASSS